MEGTEKSKRHDFKKPELVEFKTPEVVLNAPKKPTKPTEAVTQENLAKVEECVDAKASDVSEKNVELRKPIEKKCIKTAKGPSPISYESPPWASEPSENCGYGFDVLKNGSLIDQISLEGCGSFIVFGRLPECDIQLEHPSISRYHAVLQFGKDTMYPEKGW